MVLWRQYWAAGMFVHIYFHLSGVIFLWFQDCFSFHHIYHIFLFLLVFSSIDFSKRVFSCLYVLIFLGSSEYWGWKRSFNLLPLDLPRDQLLTPMLQHLILPLSLAEIRQQLGVQQLFFVELFFFLSKFSLKKEHFRRDLLTEYLHTCRSLSSFSFRDRQFVACCLFRPFLRTCDDLVSKKVKKSFLMCQKR